MNSQNDANIVQRSPVHSFPNFPHWLHLTSISKLGNGHRYNVYSSASCRDTWPPLQSTRRADPAPRRSPWSYDSPVTPVTTPPPPLITWQGWRAVLCIFRYLAASLAFTHWRLVASVVTTKMSADIVKCPPGSETAHLSANDFEIIGRKGNVLLHRCIFQHSYFCFFLYYFFSPNSSFYLCYYLS